MWPLAAVHLQCCHSATVDQAFTASEFSVVMMRCLLHCSLNMLCLMSHVGVTSICRVILLQAAASRGFAGSGALLMRHQHLHGNLLKACCAKSASQHNKCSQVKDDMQAVKGKCRMEVLGGQLLPGAGAHLLLIIRASTTGHQAIVNPLHIFSCYTLRLRSPQEQACSGATLMPIECKEHLCTYTSVSTSQHTG